ncbi:MAG TPA: hypothetical protein RMG48_12580 [Myxococcales bacterium LLY-WYZ-16_1]|jgi:hypothetical protein|nr:hypothetical protein [Myxococcales bacterium LLY-WYZ-16_1]
MSHERDTMIEAVVGAYRYQGADGRIRPAPAWRDLTPEDRVEAARQAEVQRRIEAELDPGRLSTTAHAVLARIRR